MPRKKYKKSAFGHYVDDYRSGQRAAGRVISERTASAECTKRWERLHPERRLHYCNMANPMMNRVDRHGVLQPVPENMEWLDPVTGEYGEKWYRYVKAGDEMNYLRSNIVTEKATATSPFYIIHFNYFCRTDYKKYLPAEVGVVEFSLLEGIKREFHRIIDPGKIPLGFAGEAKQLCQNVHGIEPPPDSKGENLEAVQTALRRFLKYNRYDPTMNAKIRPLFALHDNILASMHMLNDMVEYTEDVPVFRAYPVHKLFYFMKNKTADIASKTTGFADDMVAQKEIDRDCFRFVIDIACEYHQKSESTYPSCSLSIARRLAYMICCHCCEYMDIPLIAGVHVHKNFHRFVPQDEDSEEYDKPLNAVGGCLVDPLPQDGTDDDNDIFKKKPGPLNKYERMSNWYNQSLRHMITSYMESDSDEDEEVLEYYLNNPDLDEKPGENEFYVRLTPRVEGEDESNYQPTPAEQIAALRRDENRKIRDHLIAKLQEKMARRACESLCDKMENLSSGEGTSRAGAGTSRAGAGTSRAGAGTSRAGAGTSRAGEGAWREEACGGDEAWREEACGGAGASRGEEACGVGSLLRLRAHERRTN